MERPSENCAELRRIAREAYPVQLKAQCVKISARNGTFVAIRRQGVAGRGGCGGRDASMCARSAPPTQRCAAGERAPRKANAAAHSRPIAPEAMKTDSHPKECTR